MQETDSCFLHFFIFAINSSGEIWWSAFDDLVVFQKIFQHGEF